MYVKINVKIYIVINIYFLILQNTILDSLSRLPNFTINLITFESDLKFNFALNPDEFRKEQLNDLKLKTYIDYFERDIIPNGSGIEFLRKCSDLYMQNGLLYKLKYQDNNPSHAKLCIAIPAKFINQILDACHTDPLAAHQGIQRTYDLISTRYWWPKMSADVKEYCRSCIKCIARKTPRIYKAGYLKPIKVSKPWELIGMDILGPLPLTKRGYRYILVFCDYLTRFPICVPLKDISAKTV